MTNRSRGRTSSNRPLDNCGLGVSCIGAWARPCWFNSVARHHKSATLHWRLELTKTGSGMAECHDKRR
jgi:hypothetical protein